MTSTSTHSAGPTQGRGALGRALDDAQQSHGSFELVLSPLLLGLLGWWLDAKVFHTTPWLTVIFAVLALSGAVVKIYYTYRAHMAALGPVRRRLPMPTDVDHPDASPAGEGTAA